VEERILVIRFSSLGDILLTAPAIRALRRRFPESRLELLVAQEFRDAAGLIPGVDRILTFDRRSGFAGLWTLRAELTRRYAVLVDLQNSFRSAFLRATTFPTLWVRAKRYRFTRWLLVTFKWNRYHRSLPVPLRYLDALAIFGVHDDQQALDLSVPPVIQEWAAAFLDEQKLDHSGFAVLCPGAKHFTKRWPEERWRELGAALATSGIRSLIVGGNDERDLVERLTTAISESVAVINRTIPEVAALMEKAGVVISNDSGLMHLAAGVAAPVVAIFGPTVEEFGFYPFRATAEIFEHKLYCRPCTAIGGPRCPEKHFRCMLETTASTVLDAARRHLEDKEIRSN
jgi:lipopolysaccharide heptosyltransferase II